MAKFLFTTLPTNDLGLLTRSLPIARELAKRSHEVIFSSPAAAPRRLVAAAGFSNLAPRHPIYELLDVERTLRGFARFLITRKSSGGSGSLLQFLGKVLRALPSKYPPKSHDIWDMDHAAALMGMLNEGFLRAHCEAFEELIRSCGADVIVDFWNPFAVVAARAAKKPVVTVIQSNAHPRSGGFLYWRTPPADTPSPAATMNRVLRDRGLAPVTRLADLSIGDLTLVVGMPETDPLPPHTDARYVGAILWEAEQARLPERIAAIPPGKPLIWIYSGNPRYSSSDDTLNSEVILYACKEALGDQDVNVVVTTGHHPLPQALLPLPANFFHEAYVPGLQMAQRADLLIHHGGYGSCQTGLYAGKPAVILPTYSERLSNARRLEAAGAARVVAVGRRDGQKWVHAAELRDAVRAALDDPQYGANARRLGERLRAHGGAPQAARLIEEFARARCDA